MFVMAMVFVSVFVLMTMIVVHIAYCIVRLLWWAAACRSCVVKQLTALVLCSGLPLVCWVAACRSGVVHCIIVCYAAGAARLLCSCLHLVCWVAACRSCLLNIVDLVLSSGLPIVCCAGACRSCVV